MPRSFCRYVWRLASLLLRNWLWIAVWLAGAWVTWRLAPVAPLARWKLPAQEVIRGFLDDSKTVLTFGFQSTNQPYGKSTAHGPLVVRDAISGAALHATLSTNDKLVGAGLVPQQKLLQIVQKVKQVRLGSVPPPSWLYRITWRDTHTQETVCSIEMESAVDYPENLSTWIPGNLAPDRTRVVYQTLRNGIPTLICQEVGTNLELFARVGEHGIVHFSPDSRRLLARHQRAMVILDARTGQEQARLQEPQELFVPSNPSLMGLWSPDAEMISVNTSTVFESGTGKLLVVLPGDRRYMRFPLFTPDSQYVAAPATDEEGVWINYYEPGSGREIKERRLLVFPRLGNDVPSVQPHGGPGDRWLITVQYPTVLPGTLLDQLVDRCRNYLGLGPRWAPRPLYAVVDVTANRVVATGQTSAGVHHLSPDGQLLITLDLAGEVSVWTVPPSRDLKWWWAALAGWTTLIVILQLGVMAARWVWGSRLTPAKIPMS